MSAAALEYSPYAYEIHEDPYPTYARLRAEAPAYRNDTAGFWALSRHADVMEGFRDNVRLSSAHGVSLDPAASGPHAHRTMSFLAMDPPMHGRIRGLVSRGFTPGHVAELEPRIRAITRELLDVALAKDSFDFIGDLAGKLPMDVISELIGVPPADRDEVRRLSDLLVHREEGMDDVPPAGVEAAFALITYYADMLAQRRAAPTDDLTSALLAAEVDGDRLTDDEIMGFLFLMVVAGNETTTKLLGNAWYWAWRNPDQQAKPLADPARVPAWIEETLRYDTSTQMLARVAAVDVPIHDTVIPAGDRVVLVVGSANRDERAFANPDHFDLDRSERELQQIASFGFGRHFCLGASLARLEARVALEELVARVADYDIDPAGTTRVHSVNVRGFATLPHDREGARMTLIDPPRVSGDHGGTGHLEELRADPIGLMERVRRECGDVGIFRLADKDVVLLTGPEANEMFFRAPEEDLDQAEAYPFMTPIFGEGVVFDASPEERRQALHNQALRDKFMRGHAETIASEVERMLDASSVGAGKEIDLLDWFAELTIYTSSACLIGQRFREQLDGSFARLYHDLEQGTDAIAFVDPYADIDSFRRRDEARVGLVALVQAIMDGRADSEPPAKDDRDLLDVLMSIHDEDGSLHFSVDIITGMFISMMFAGHHTTSGTAAWTLIELLRHPDFLAEVVDELDALAAEGHEVSYQALREMPKLEAAIKEALRLHPPLILLLRVAKVDLEVEGYRIPAGALVGASPSVSNRLPEAFADAEAFDPVRYLDPRDDAGDNPWSWIPFGAGRHRCVGAAFAMMQLKAIFSVLLRKHAFELTQPHDSYRNDHSKMVVQLAQPCAAVLRPRA